MDVTDDASVRAAAGRKLGEIDGVIYCAGAYEPMSAENWDVDAALKVSEVNYTGACAALATWCRAWRRAGRAHRADRLACRVPRAARRHRLRRQQIGADAPGREPLHGPFTQGHPRVQQVNPGFIKTRLTEKNTFDMPYIITADDAARRTLRAMKSGRFATSYPWQMAAFFRAGAMMPIRLFRRLMGV